MYSYLLTQDEKLVTIISWLPDQRSFQIFNVSAFTENVLPRHFKHSNMASFVRQLNMYGFSRPLNSHQHVYIHPKFQKGNFSSMKFIKKMTGGLKMGQNGVSLKSNNKEQGSEQYYKINHSFQKLKSENNQLKRQNEELKLRLFFFQQAIKSTRSIFFQMNQIIEQPFQETENQKSQNLANSTDSTQINSSVIGKSAFSICKTSCQKNEDNNG